ncbi:MAG: hypothetical protein WCE62_06935 [Polyangiales bacterium]
MRDARRHVHRWLRFSVLLEARQVRKLVEVRLKRDLDATVERAALRGIVAGDRLGVGVGGSRNTSTGNAVLDEELRDVDRACTGERPSAATWRSIIGTASADSILDVVALPLDPTRSPSSNAWKVRDPSPV